MELADAELPPLVGVTDGDGVADEPLEGVAVGVDDSKGNEDSLADTAPADGVPEGVMVGDAPKEGVLSADGVREGVCVRVPVCVVVPLGVCVRLGDREGEAPPVPPYVRVGDVV